MTLRDPFGREVKGLRIAVTSRCNLSCLYCHHEGEKAKPSSRPEISEDEIVTVVSAGEDMGITKVKITGGEPLLRANLESILERLPEGIEVSLTTNGLLLAERARSLAEAGLDRVNVSLDSSGRRSTPGSRAGPRRTTAGSWRGSPPPSRRGSSPSRLTWWS